MNSNYSYPSNSDRPDTLEDWILLLKSIRDQFGNMKVRCVEEACQVNDEVHHFHFSDLVIAGGNKSLIQNSNESSAPTLVFVYD